MCQIRGVVASVLGPVVNTGWTGMQKAAEKLQEKMEPILAAGLEPILKAVAFIKEKIRSKGY